MSGNSEEEKNETGKLVPLDLARNQMNKTIEGKVAAGAAVATAAPIVIPGQHLRGMRVLTQTVAASGTTNTTPTIITTNILPSAVLKQGT